MDTNNQHLPAVPPAVQTQQPEVIEGVPIPYKVPDYDDAIPVGKSVAIVGGIILAMVGIFFLARTSQSVDLTPEQNQLDFSKMNAKQQPQQQGQVAGMQSYGPQAAPSVSAEPTDKAKKSPTPTESATPTPTHSPTPTPTNHPDPTNTPTPTQTPTPTDTPTPTPTVTNSPTPTP